MDMAVNYFVDEGRRNPISKSSKHNGNNILQIEGFSRVISAAGYSLTKDPAWFALLLTILVFILTWHSLRAHRSAGERRNRRVVSRASDARSTQQARRTKVLKRLPRLNISSSTPLRHLVKYDSSCNVLVYPGNNTRVVDRSQSVRSRSRAGKA
jgi:hypothetical protein